MSVIGVNGAQSPEFVELVNQPQVAYTNSPQLTMSAQPQVDSYEGPRQEPEKKGSFLGKAFKTILLAGALVGLNVLAHKGSLGTKAQEWLKPAEENSTKFAEKYIKKPLNSLDEFVLKNYEKYIAKSSAKTEPAASA